MAATTLTTQLSHETGAKLARLSEGTRRSRTVLAAEAVDAYVEAEVAAAEGIRQGLDDCEAGRLVPHEEAMAEIETVLAAAEARAAS